MTMMDDATGANLEIEALRSAKLTDSQIAKLVAVRERNHRRPLEITIEAGKLAWWRWLITSGRMTPGEAVEALPVYFRRLAWRE